MAKQSRWCLRSRYDTEPLEESAEADQYIGDQCLAPSRHGLTSSQISLISTRGSSSHTPVEESEQSRRPHSLSQDRATPLRTHDEAITPPSDENNERRGSTPSPHDPNTDPADTTKDMVQLILGKVQDRLGLEQHSANDTGIQDRDEGHSHPGSNHWMNDDQNLRMIIQTVLQEVKVSAPRSAPTAHSHCSLEVPRQPRKGPSLHGNAIEPQASTVADTATTISQPRTSFLTRSLDSGRIHTKIREHDANTMILSRRSITDIKWLSNSNETAITRWGTLENSNDPPIRKLSGCDSKFSVSTKRVDHTGLSPGPSTSASAYGYAENNGVFPPRNGYKENSPDGSTPVKRFSLESFPALLKREDTQDWLSPPADLSITPPSQERNDMYDLGIDARSSSVV